MWASGICETTRRQWRVRGQTNLVPRVFSFFPLAILENDKTLEKGQSADHFKTISTNEHRKWCSVLSALFSQSSDIWCCIVCAKAAKHLKGVALTSLNRSNFIVNFLLFSGYICWSVRITKKGGGDKLIYMMPWSTIFGVHELRCTAKTDLWIVIEVHSMKHKLPKFLILYTYIGDQLEKKGVNLTKRPYLVAI